MQKCSTKRLGLIWAGQLLVLLSVATACTQTPESGERRLRDYPAFVKLPPGPECPPGEFIAGWQPHPFCVTNEEFDEYYGDRY
jgi:hypothetical protein